MVKITKMKKNNFNKELLKKLVKKIGSYEKFNREFFRNTGIEIASQSLRNWANGIYCPSDSDILALSLYTKVSVDKFKKKL